MAAKSTKTRTARKPRPAAQQQAETDALAADNRAAAESRVTNASAASDGKSVAQHSANPDNPKDSTARHSEPPVARADGTGEGGFPQGEYDVTRPASAPGVSAAAQQKAALTAHYEGADEQLDQVIKDAVADSRLDEGEFLKVLEAMPVGTILEHEAPNRWRAHKVGQNRFGHGATALQAVENYVLGDASPTIQGAAAENFLKLPAADQKAIEQRDQAAAQSVGGSDPQKAARDQARQQAKKK